MVIEKSIKMTLEDAEVNALKTLKETYIQCGITEQYDCDVCPLLYRDVCLGKYAERIMNERSLK